MPLFGQIQIWLLLYVPLLGFCGYAIFCIVGPVVLGVRELLRTDRRSTVIRPLTAREAAAIRDARIANLRGEAQRLSRELDADADGVIRYMEELARPYRSAE